MDLTRYQELIVKYLEAEYREPAGEAIQFLHTRLRYSDIAKQIGCSEKTLRVICEGLGVVDEPPTRLDYTPHYPNATDFFKQFDNIEDAVVECRDSLALSITDTEVKLGISRTSVVRHTPEYLKGTYNFSKKRQHPQRSPSDDHPWR